LEREILENVEKVFFVENNKLFTDLLVANHFFKMKIKYVQ